MSLILHFCLFLLPLLLFLSLKKNHLELGCLNNEQKPFHGRNFFYLIIFDDIFPWKTRPASLLLFSFRNLVAYFDLIDVVETLFSNHTQCFDLKISFRLVKGPKITQIIDHSSEIPCFNSFIHLKVPNAHHETNIRNDRNELCRVKTCIDAIVLYYYYYWLEEHPVLL